MGPPPHCDPFPPFPPPFFPPPQLEKLKAEQSKQPATPLLGRKFLGDPPPATPPTPITTTTSITPMTPQRPGGDETPEPPQPRVAYVRQELRPERLQPKVDRVRDGEGAGDRDPPAALPAAAVPPDLGSAKGDGGGDGGDVRTGILERRRERRERRMERQESSEQEGMRHG